MFLVETLSERSVSSCRAIDVHKNYTSADVIAMDSATQARAKPCMALYVQDKRSRRSITDETFS